VAKHQQLVVGGGASLLVSAAEIAVAQNAVFRREALAAHGMLPSQTGPRFQRVAIVDLPDCLAGRFVEGFGKDDLDLG